MNISPGGEWGSSILNKIKKEKFFEKHGNYNEYKQYMLFEKWIHIWSMNRSRNKTENWIRHWVFHKISNKTKQWLYNHISHVSQNKTKSWINHWISGVIKIE